MLDAAEVRTAIEYFDPTLIPQGVEATADYLLAHALAVNSIALGN